MADYRLECCGGFPNHKSGCAAYQQEVERHRQRNQEQRRRDDAWKAFFRNMNDEELFEYADKARAELKKAYKWQERQRQVLAYMRDNYMSQRYLDRRRNKN